MPHTWLCNQQSLPFHLSISYAVLQSVICTRSCVSPDKYRNDQPLQGSRSSCYFISLRSLALSYQLVGTLALRPNTLYWLSGSLRPSTSRLLQYVSFIRYASMSHWLKTLTIITDVCSTLGSATMISRSYIKEWKSSELCTRLLLQNGSTNNIEQSSCSIPLALSSVSPTDKVTHFVNNVGMLLGAWRGVLIFSLL